MTSSWKLFNNGYNFYGKGAKATRPVDWEGEQGSHRHHAENGPLSKDKVEYARRMHELVKRHILDGEPVDGRKQHRRRPVRLCLRRQGAYRLHGVVTPFRR